MNVVMAGEAGIESICGVVAGFAVPSMDDMMPCEGSPMPAVLAITFLWRFCLE